MSRQKTQLENVLLYLQEHKQAGITPLEALQMFGCFRLSAIIYNLKKQGYKIKTEIVKIETKHFANYKLI